MPMGIVVGEDESEVALKCCYRLAFCCVVNEPADGCEGHC